ncbi:hypothetical protein Nepgr_002996 [Nepenthes gracilis]|uniref:Exocyst subunit Exo70 family protein n=1 Tax=Nepenthes gracilis TaxID=150966 RepID=A0AAD3RYQ1_NEPGR|nr:hypothetical protein Nepgr_002996 [Nepenthes gracilis]
MATTIEGEERVLATAQHIVKSLRTSKDVTDDMLSILSSFDNRLSNITDLINNTSSSGNKVDMSDELSHEVSRFESAERLILRRDSASNHFWEDYPDDSCEYLASIDEILRLMEDLEFKGNAEIMDRAECAVQMAMSKLEDEFRYILLRNTVPLDAEQLYCSIRRVSLSFVANEGDIIEDFENFGEHDGESGSKHCYHERGGSLGGDIRVDLINHAVIADLREIAERMIRAGYEKECCQVYSSVRRDILDECLAILGVEKLSIEEVQRIEWTAFDEKMKKWVQAVKIVVKVLLIGEKRLCEQIFDGSESIKEVCFTETAKACVMQLLNFGEAVSIGKRSSEKLFRILDMYHALADALPELHALFSDESRERVCSEVKGVLDGLREAAKGTFKEFEKAVKGESSSKPLHGGGIHPLARYVMNYVKLIVDYGETLNSILASDAEEEDHPQGDVGDARMEMSPIGRRLMLLMNSLESNLDEKAKLYDDIALQHVFLMNNKLYIVQKVKDSELGKLLGDEWVKRRRGLVRKNETNYLRASWSKVLACLKDEGIGGSSGNAPKMALKERFKNFNVCFEEIYRIQTAWNVPDPQLRAELKISISEKLIPAYRLFLGRFANQLESVRHAGKYIKYTEEDLECYLADLFEGTPVLHPMRRKNP